jgi:hypothetical protein
MKEKLSWKNELWQNTIEGFWHCRSLLVWNGIGFWPFHKLVHTQQEVLVSLIAPWEGPCYIDGYPFERGTDVVLMNLAQIPGSDTTTGCTGVALLAPLLNIVSCLDYAIPYPGYCWHPSHLMMVHHVVRSARCSLCSKGELSYFWSSISRFPMAL